MSKKVNTPSVDELEERISTLLTTLGSVREFKIHDAIKGHVMDMADCVAEGDFAGATRATNEAEKAGRNIFRAFLRFAVVDRPGKLSRFTTEINAMREAQYHEDIVAKVESVRRKYEELVRTEVSDDFSKRIAGYNEVIAIIAWAEQQQTWRDSKNISAKDAKKALRRREKEDAEEVARSKAATAAQRERVLAERQAKADAIRAMIA